MKIPLEVFVISNNGSWLGKQKFEAWSCDPSKHNPAAYSFVTTTNIEVEIPDDFDPVATQVECLKAKKQEILATAQVQANNIEDQIQRLLCIEYKPEAA